MTRKLWYQILLSIPVVAVGVPLFIYYATRLLWFGLNQWMLI